MGQVKKRIFAGAVCQQIVYETSGGQAAPGSGRARLRFESRDEQKEFNRQISRRQHARKFNGAFTPAALYSTLTMDDGHEVHTFREARRLRDNFVRRLRNKYPEARIAIYMGRGKGTSRIHMHMVSEGIPREFIIEKWGMGEVLRIEQLREDNYYKGVNCGQDYTGLANYLFDHWTEEQGGHRFKMTSNIKTPEEEPATECRRRYAPTKPPRPPKGYIYIRVEYNKYGYMCFHYVKKPVRKRTKPPKMRGVD